MAFADDCMFGPGVMMPCDTEVINRYVVVVHTMGSFESKAMCSMP